MTNSLPRYFDGDFTAKIVRPEYGGGKENRPSARIVFEIVEGPRAGTQVTYEANFKAESIKYTKRNLIAAGWQGKTMATFVGDVTAKIGTTVPIQVRKASYTNPETGKLREWNAVDSIGNFAPPLSAPTADMTRNVDSWFAEIDDALNGGGGYGGSHRHPNAPGNTDDIPFASADLVDEPSPIASVLRRGV